MIVATFRNARSVTKALHQRYCDRLARAGKPMVLTFLSIIIDFIAETLDMVGGATATPYILYANRA